MTSRVKHVESLLSRSELEREILIVRQRDAFFADWLDTPFPVASSTYMTVPDEIRLMSNEYQAAVSRPALHGQALDVVQDGSARDLQPVTLRTESQNLIEEKILLSQKRDEMARPREKAIAEGDMFADQTARLERELDVLRADKADLIAERDMLRAEKQRAEAKLQAANTQNLRLAEANDKLQVELARREIKLNARVRQIETELKTVRNEAAEGVYWFEAATAVGHLRASQIPDRIKPHWRLTILLSGWRMRWSLSKVARIPSSKTLRSWANRARDERKWQVAARWYCDVLYERPWDAAIWVQLGHALKESGKVSHAETAYRKSLDLAPGIADTHLQLGHALKLQGRINEAVESYAMALRLDPGLRDAATELISAGWTENDIKQALSPEQCEHPAETEC